MNSPEPKPSSTQRPYRLVPPGPLPKVTKENYWELQKRIIALKPVERLSMMTGIPEEVLRGFGARD